VSRRLLALTAAALVTLGGAVGVWAARGGDGGAEPKCARTTFAVPDPTTGKVMSYNKRVCEDGP
jgi:hypothetical protein